VLEGVLGNKEKAATGRVGALGISVPNREGKVGEGEAKVVAFGASQAERCLTVYEPLG
jgi:hypothetical protein